MAEFVEARIEKCIPEFEELERLGLLSKNELKKLIEKLREYEYKMARPIKQKSDFISCVNYNCQLLDLLKLRREKIRLLNKNISLDNSIVLKVLKILRFMTRFWKCDLELWKMRLEFCKNKDWREEVSLSFSEMTRFHGVVREIWTDWVQWEISRNRNFEKARNILLSKASSYISDSYFVQRELFKLELTYVAYVKECIDNGDVLIYEEIVEENRDKVLNCEIPRIVFRNSVDVINDPYLYFDFYNICLDFSFASQLGEEINQHVFAHFPKSPVIWLLKAKKAALGCAKPFTSCNSENSLLDKTSDAEKSLSDEIEGNENIESHIKNLSPEEKLSAILNEFKDGLTVLGKVFFDVCIDELSALLYHVWGIRSFAKMVIRDLCNTFKILCDVLTPYHYYFWSVLCSMKSVVQRKKCLYKGVTAYPNCSALVSEYFAARLDNFKSDKQCLACFHKITNELHGTPGVTTWMAAIDFLKSDVKRKKLFEKAVVNSDNLIAENLRIKYLNWVYNKKGFSAMYKLYQKLCFFSPFSLNFHLSAISLALKEAGKIDNARKMFEIAVQQFGSSCHGLWLCYVYFEKNFGDPLNVPSIWTKAETLLTGSQITLLLETKIFIQTYLSADSEASAPDSNNEMMQDKKEEYKAPLIDVVEIDLTHSQIDERSKFFSSLNKFAKMLKNEKLVNYEEKWKECFKDLTSIDLHKVNICSNSKNLDDKVCALDRLEQQNNITHQCEQQIKSNLEENVSLLLKKSMTLSSEFIKQKEIVPYYISKRKKLAAKKKEREKTKGPGWFNMKAPEASEEKLRDLHVLKMRSVLNPKHHYKKNLIKELPKFYQVGKVLDSPVDFYSSRIPIKERTKSFADEIMHDETVLRYGHTHN